MAQLITLTDSEGDQVLVNLDLVTTISADMEGSLIRFSAPPGKDFLNVTETLDTIAQRAAQPR